MARPAKKATRPGKKAAARKLAPSPKRARVASKPLRVPQPVPDVTMAELDAQQREHKRVVASFESTVFAYQRERDEWRDMYQRAVSGHAAAQELLETTIREQGRVLTHVIKRLQQHEPVEELLREHQDKRPADYYVGSEKYEARLREQATRIEKRMIHVCPVCKHADVPEGARAKEG